MQAVILAVLAGVCWGIGEMCTRSVLHTGKVGPITAITVRSAVALPILLIAFVLARHVLKWPREQTPFAEVPGAVWLKLVLGSGLVAGAAAMIFFYSALSVGELSRVKPIAFTLAPATAVVLGYLVLHEDVSLQRWIGVGVILLGVAILTRS